MTQPISRHVRLALLGAAVLPLFLAGCADPDQPRWNTYATWKQAEPVPQPQLAQVPVHHSVAFAGAGIELSDTEREALSLFLQRNAIAPGGRVTLSAALPSNGDATTLGARLSAVRGALAQLGYGAATLPPGSSAGSTLPPDAIVVTGRVLAVLPPDCPGYNQPLQFDLEHRPILSPGCANAVNLGLMVADPTDLQGTTPLAPADGAAAAPSIQRYRQGEVYPQSQPSSTVPLRTSTF